MDALNLKEAYAALPRTIQPVFFNAYKNITSRRSANGAAYGAYPYSATFLPHSEGSLGISIQRVNRPIDLHIIANLKPEGMAGTTVGSDGFTMQNGDLIMGVNDHGIDQFQAPPEIDPSTGGYTLPIAQALLLQLKARPLRMFMMRVYEKQATVTAPPMQREHQSLTQLQQTQLQQQLLQRSQMLREQHAHAHASQPRTQSQLHTIGHDWLTKLESTDNDGDGDDDLDDTIGLAADDVSFTTYQPPKLKFGLPHPDTVSEATSLASTLPPDITYELQIPMATVQSGCLSALQLESIVYASQRHETTLSDGRSRAGFFLGDGAGVGKGRQVAGLILENHLRGRTKVRVVTSG
jgi:hypothetical protein